MTTPPWPTCDLNLPRKALVLAAETCERAWELLGGVSMLLNATFGVSSPQGRYSDRIRRFQIVRGVLVSDAAAALQTKEPASYWGKSDFLEEFLPQSRLPKRFSTQVKAKILTVQDEAIRCLELLLGLLPSLGDYTDIAWKTKWTQHVLALLRKQRDIVVATKAD